MNNSAPLFDAQPNVKLRLALGWTAFMFLYIYVDFFHLFMPGVIEDMLAGRVFVFDISAGFLLSGLVSVSIPAMMIVFSVIGPARINRVVNIVIAVIYIPYTLFNLVGDAWIHMYYGAAVELGLLAVIIISAWNWPRGLGHAQG